MDVRIRRRDGSGYWERRLVVTSVQTDNKQRFTLREERLGGRDFKAIDPSVSLDKNQRGDVNGVVIPADI